MMNIKFISEMFATPFPRANFTDPNTPPTPYILWKLP
jgi:hypothetical protein